jgi:hypothetical protein
MFCSRLAVQILLVVPVCLAVLGDRVGRPGMGAGQMFGMGRSEINFTSKLILF